MSEEDRSSLYDWLREQTGEHLAEYVMSCLLPAPLTDVATKSDVGKVKSEVAVPRSDVGKVRSDMGKLESRFDRLLLLREADRVEMTAQREADRAEMATQREADRAEMAAQREADRKRSTWFVGSVGIALSAQILATHFGWIPSGI
ncbi:hypothetical protein [Candidatus Poriferisodalis sp.]|uniref:hypothetical protein n=1 Tax=Candidatus Poriferisodalis sp. TaxID=3101277 RepID=UPI003B5C712B